MYLLGLLDAGVVELQVGFGFSQVPFKQWLYMLVSSVHVILKLKSCGFPRRDIRAVLGITGQLITEMELSMLRFQCHH